MHFTFGRNILPGNFGNQHGPKNISNLLLVLLMTLPIIIPIKAANANPNQGLHPHLKMFPFQSLNFPPKLTLATLQFVQNTNKVE